MQARTTLVFLVAASLMPAFGSAVAASGNAAEGAKKAAACEACHGKDGNGIAPNYPALAGQYPDYLQQALHAYQSGKRTNAIMNGMAAPLSDQDIQDLAAYFSGLPSKLSDLHDKIQGGN